MVEIRVYDDIANKKEGIWMSAFGFEDSIFSAEAVKNIFDANQSEKDFKFNIHCNGGSVTEGLAIYDIIRNSGKTIYSNIEGSCHSMAVCILLSAPFENRTANRNCRALIHEVRGGVWDYLTADEMRELANEVEMEQDAILDIYADRTGYNRDELETLMKEEKQRTAQELLDYGFISQINNYTTNQKNEKMSKRPNRTNNQSLMNRAATWLRNAANLLADTVNYDFTDEEGNVLFSTESEDDTLEIGMAASPDGTFELSDGTTVTISGGEITDIVVPNADPEETEALVTENRELRNSLSEAHQLITDLKEQIKSTYNVNPRIKSPGKKTNGAQKTSNEKKEEVREKLQKMRGGK